MKHIDEIIEEGMSKFLVNKKAVENDDEMSEKGRYIVLIDSGGEKTVIPFYEAREASNVLTVVGIAKKDYSSDEFIEIGRRIKDGETYTCRRHSYGIMLREYFGVHKIELERNRAAAGFMDMKLFYDRKK